jgi:hypothetical protein
MCTRGEYRGVLHDRYFSAASSFQIGVSRDRRTCSSGMLASVRYLRLENGDEVGRCRARREGRRIASATSPAGWKGSDEAAAQPASPTRDGVTAQEPCPIREAIRWRRAGEGGTID